MMAMQPQRQSSEPVPAKVDFHPDRIALSSRARDRIRPAGEPQSIIPFGKTGISNVGSETSDVPRLLLFLFPIVRGDGTAYGLDRYEYEDAVCTPE